MRLEMKSFDYLIGHIPYQIFKITFNKTIDKIHKNIPYLEITED